MREPAATSSEPLKNKQRENQKPGQLPRIGIIGAGQLAKMLAQAATELGCEIIVLDPDPQAPAHKLAADSLLARWDQPEPLLDLASRVDVVTFENEFVPANVLEAIEKAGHSLYPSSASLRLIQDKYLQKQTLAAAGVPVPLYQAVESEADVAAAAKKLGWPLVLKARRNGYDGKGNATVHSVEDIPEAWAKLGGGKNGLYVEQFCHYSAELAVMITRGRNGESVVYPVVESIQQNHICHQVKVSDSLFPKELRERVVNMANAVVTAFHAVGSFGIELFLTKTGEVLLNEIAPRVHNSGHYTIEACECSQFENHIRAILGWPLGSPRLVAPAAVMVNLLGASAGPGMPLGVAEALQAPGAHLHIYGKTQSKAGRKMGHLTALGSTLEEALTKATSAASKIQFGS
ncbi:MAG: 5-(carboxyamino)imidazole ribonucleotide synthase [Verrucomicrobiales bacterium]